MWCRYLIDTYLAIIPLKVDQVDQVGQVNGPRSIDVPSHVGIYVESVE